MIRTKALVGIATIALILAIAAMAGPTANAAPLAATTPNLGMATTFGILASTYTNTAPGTTINGDLGYTTLPAVNPTVNGTTHVADGTYNQAGTAQGSALTALNAQPCSFTFAPGAIDLATDTTHGGIGIYAPGVYCVTGAASVGAAGITLTGSGTYIFRMSGALTTVANSVVGFASGASPCDVFWTPGAATTLGATSTFLGTDIDASGITIGDTVLWTGRALAFGGTVSTVRDTITAPTCAVPATPGPAGTVPPTCAPGFGGTFPQCVALQTSVPFPTASQVPAQGGGGFSGGTPGPTSTPTPVVAAASPSPTPAVSSLPSTATLGEDSMLSLILPILLIVFAVLYLVARARRRGAHRPA